MFSARTDWPLVPNRFSEELEERRRRNLRVLDLTEPNPTHCGLLYDAQEILSALADPGSLIYEPDPRGPILARRAVASYYGDHGVTVDPERIFLTASTSEAYSYIFRLLADPGDNVLVPRPSYPLFDFLSRLDDVELIPYHLVYNDGWHMDLRSLDAAFNSGTRAILVVNPNNPTGSFVTPSELERLIDLCADHRLALISDEVFSDYALAPDAPRRPGRSLRPRERGVEALTFTLSGLSKISALPQMKLAWLVVSGAPDRLKSALARLELIADTSLSVSGAVANALPRLLQLRHSMHPQILAQNPSNFTRLEERLLP